MSSNKPPTINTNNTIDPFKKLNKNSKDDTKTDKIIDPESATGTPVESSADISRASPEKIEKNKKGRCAQENCKKKITLMGFDCKCKLRFCIAHLPAEVHFCTFDYKSEHKNKLKKDNQPVAPIKVNKI